MRDLRRERELLGMSREEVAAATRIPMRYVTALEEAEDAGKSPPPFLFGYRRQYESFLDSLGEGAVGRSTSGPAPYVRAEPEPEPEAEEAPRGLPVARLILGGFLATLVLVLAVEIGGAVMDHAPEGAQTTPGQPVASEPKSDLPVQKVELRAIEPTRVTVIADGQTLFSGVMDPGVTQTYEGHERMSVDASDLTKLTVRHDGSRIEPLGNLSFGRRLVFIQEKP